MEVELKLALDDVEDLPRLLAQLPEPEAVVEQRNRYLGDTEGRVAAARIMVRVREEHVVGQAPPAELIVTLKRRTAVKAGVFEAIEREQHVARSDWERVLAGDATLYDVAPDALAELRERVGEVPLTARGELRNVRRRIRLGEHLLEVDSTSFPGGVVEAEVEVETDDTEGARAAVLAVAAAAGVGLHEQTEGKYARYLAYVAALEPAEAQSESAAGDAGSEPAQAAGPAVELPTHAEEDPPAPVDEPPDDATDAPPPARPAGRVPPPPPLPGVEELELADAPSAPSALEAHSPPATRRAGPDWSRLGWAAAVVLVLGALVLLAASVKSFTIPFLTAFIIAYILDPVVDWFEARKIARSPAIVVLLVGFILVLGAVVLLMGPQVARELGELPAKLRELVARLGPWLESTFELQLPSTFSAAIDSLVSTLQPDQAEKLLKPVSTVAGVIYGGTASVLAFLIGLVMVPVFAFYLLRDFDIIVARLADLVPMGYRGPVGARFREIDEAMSSFVRGQLTVAAILTVLYAVGLSLVGLPLALVVALIAGVGNMVPYLGTTIGLVLATLMALLDWQGFGQLAWIYGVFGIAQFLEGWVLTPRIVGESVGLSSLAVIVAVLVFGELFGFFGVLVAVPLAAVLKILGRVAIEQYRASGFFRAPS